MTKDELIKQLQESDTDGSEEVGALSSDGTGFSITGVSVHRGMLCITEGDEVDVWPEGDEDDLDEDEDDI